MTKRSRSPSPPQDTKRKPNEDLERVLRRQVALTTTKTGTYCDPNAYHSSRRILSLPDHEVGLYARYDPVLRRDVVTWERCQYTLGRRFGVEREHREGCTGWAKDKPRSLMGRLLHTCDCPDRVEEGQGVWLVDPKEVEVEHCDGEGKTKCVRHGDVASTC